jgi:2-polyprenyl-3-methyl-5-hydroxy-6-metoxy-1,4-benzoquinol methylase
VHEHDAKVGSYPPGWLFQFKHGTSSVRIRPLIQRRSIARMSDLLLRLLGWPSLLIHGDPLVLDRWLWVRRYLRRPNARTLDAGCGNGGFSVYAARAGNEVVAASFSERELQDARRRVAILDVAGIEFRILDLRDLDHHIDELGHFDQIICLETIEHLKDDLKLVKGLAQMLEPGGQLLLSTPFDEHNALFGETRHPSAVEDGSHVRYGYSPERLRSILEEAGLKVRDEGFVSGVVSQKLTNLMWRLTERVGLPAAWLIVLPLRALVVLDRPLTRMIGYPHLCVAVRAVKPA